MPHLAHSLAGGWRAALGAVALAVRRTSEVKSWADAHQISASSYEIYSADVAVVGSIVAAGAECIAR